MARQPVEFHPEAIAEARAAFEWYRQRSEGAAAAFLTKLADNGVMLDLNFVSIPQGVVGGGKDTTWNWGLNLTVWILRIEGSS